MSELVIAEKSDLVGIADDLIFKKQSDFEIDKSLNSIF